MRAEGGPLGGAVGDQGGDGLLGLGEGLTASGEASHRGPLPQFGVGVLDTDPGRGLPSPRLAPGVVVAIAGVLLRFLRRRGDLAGEFLGQALVAGVDLRPDAGTGPELLGDALGANSGLVVHPAGPFRPGVEQAALTVAERGGLDGVLPAFARDERPAPGAAGLRTADLGLGPVEPQFDALGLGVGKHVLQRAQAQAGPVGDCEATGREQGPDLTDRPPDGRGADVVDHGEGILGQAGAQVGQRDHQPVAEGEFVLRSRPGQTATAVSAPVVTPALAP